MKAVLLRNLKKGECFTLTDKVKYEGNVPYGEVLSKYIYVKDDYYRSEKKYWIHKYDFDGKYKLVKGDRIVYIEF